MSGDDASAAPIGDIDAGDIDAGGLDPDTLDGGPGADDGSTPEADASGRMDAGDTATEAPCKPFTMPTDCSAPSDGVLPSELRCTGLYGDFAARQLACGVERYTPLFTLWSDGTEKHRYVALPPGTHVDVSDPENFVFPVDTRLFKEFHVEVNGQSKLAETRLLHKSEAGWLYTTYVWTDDGTNAVQQNNGVPRIFGSEHSVPTRDQCRDCHEGRPDFVLGWDPVMLGDGATGLTLTRLHERDLLRIRTAGGAMVAPELAALEAVVPGDTLERGALGYLHANCGVSCHNESERASARETSLLMRLDLDTLASVSSTAVVATGANRLPGPNAKLPPGGPYYDLRPGDPEHSLLTARMAVRGETQMPEIGTDVVDAEGLSLVTRWIASMAGNSAYPAPAPLDQALPGSDPSDAGAPLDIDAGPPDATTPPDEPMQPDTGAPESCDATRAPDVSGFATRVLVEDAQLETLSFAAQAPGSDDWYLVEMRGRIMRLRDGVLEATPFLDLTSAIELGAGFDQTSVGYDERGLVGLAFAPDFETSGLFYVAITPSRVNSLGLPYDHDMVVEYRRGADGQAPSRERILIELPSAPVRLGNIHNINTIRFGSDGMLYVGSGDGGGVLCGNAEPNASQDVGSAFGKLLRLDLSQPAPYGALDNPFAGVPGGDPRVLHYGLRNPFRFSFDRATGDLYLGDVGQNRYEELNFAPSGSAGLNFGWATFEGVSPCPSATRELRSGSTHTPPMFIADRAAFGSATPLYRDYRAVVGGMVYRGTELPELQGAYLFGDYYGARLGALYRCNEHTSPVSPLRKQCDPNDPAAACLATPAGTAPLESLTAIVEDHAGELYFVANGNSLRKLIAAP